MAKDQYFAAKPAKECVAVLESKASTHYTIVNTSNYLNKVRRSWRYYHGAFNSDVGEGHQISFSGEQGEIAQLSINHYRNIAQHILQMITASRPSLEARAVNTDYKSLVQATLANGLLDYYMREKKLEMYLKSAVEYAVVLGAGYIKMEWNATGGEAFEFNEETNTPIYEGDVEFSNLSPFDVYYDVNKNNANFDWIIVRSFKNKYDLMAKYPEMADDISAVGSNQEFFKFNILPGYDDTDDVPVYEFFHKRTEAMPEGRYVLYLSSNVILADAPMPYRRLPVFMIAPSTILGTPLGYTPMFDLLPIQESVNSLYTTILTNQNAFGVQNVLLPRGSDIVVQNLQGGLNVIEYNSQAGRPEPLNLTNTPQEVFAFLATLEKQMETVSGVSSVTRGNPESSLKSGNALALVQSMSLQFMSGLQQSYVMMIESVGTALIEMLKDFAAAPRVAAIVGKSNRTELRQFKGDDLSQISRVVVDLGNPLARTTAGRVEMAQQLLQMQAVTTPQQYLQILNTGKLEVMTEDTTSQLMNMRSENERLTEGLTVAAIVTDNHSLHVKEHSVILNDPILREDPELVARVLGHIQEHIDLLKNADPDVLTMTGQQPLAPPSAPPAPNAQPGPGPGGPIDTPTEILNNPDLAAPEMAQDVQVPAPATPPGEFENLPTNPAEMI
jgi:hypothetical protein